MRRYKITISNVQDSVFSNYNKYLKKEVHYYSLLANQVIIKILDSDDPIFSKIFETDYSFIVIKEPTRKKSTYIEDALINEFETILQEVNKYKHLFPKRNRALLTIIPIKEK